MTEYHIRKQDSYNKLISYLKTHDGTPEWQGNRLITKDYTFIISGKYEKFLEKTIPKVVEVNMDDLIYGKDKTQHVTAVEVLDNQMYLYKNDGTVETRDFQYWLTSKRKLKNSQLLDGSLDFKYISYYDDEEKFKDDKKKLWGNSFTAYDLAESAMLTSGVTLFKGMQINEVSVLSFDIESEGLLDEFDTPISKTPEIYMISNTYRDRDGSVTKKLFDLNDYYTTAGMIEAWCEWVVEIDPTVLTGHNVFGYDLPYLNYMYKREVDLDLPIGKNGRAIHVNYKPSKFRKDGSQTYDYKNIKAFGRQIIDTFFLSIKYDIGRNYPSYGLKAIIKYEGLEKEGRIIWDFMDNPTKRVWEERETNPEVWEQFKEYCIDDSDDSLHLFDLMAPSFFYYTQSVPKSFQAINNSATGSQINSFLVRSYLQMGHSLPSACEKEPFEGAISSGVKGVHSHVNKVDVRSLYPSIMIQNKVYDEEKDPHQHFLKMVEFFTAERISNKMKGKETGERYYKDMEQAQKIVINSAYGLLGASGLNFNSPKNAALVTEEGREILQKGVEWASGQRFVSVPKLLKNGKPKLNDNGDIITEWVLGDKISDGKGFEIVNCDTDSFSYTKGYDVDTAEFNKDIDELNSLYPENIIWEDDGQFSKVIVVKAKNYVLQEKGTEKIKYKGSSLTDQKKEPALIEFLQKMIGTILENSSPEAQNSLYDEFVKEAYNIVDINRWAVKKTITKAVFESDRKQEKDVRDAFNGRTFSEGDKIWLYRYIRGKKQKVVKGEPVFYKKDNSPILVDDTALKMVQDYDHNYNKMHYVDRVYSTLEILSNVVDIEVFTKYKNKCNLVKLKTLVGE
jgi:DNA polymerase elongation subunit (family B)